MSETLTKPQAPALQQQAWRQLKVDLAAAHRIAAMQNFNEGIYNHLTAFSADKPDRFVALPFGRHWAEAVASELLEVGFDGATLKGDGVIESSAFNIHAPIHQARPECAAVFHTHMPFASALTRLDDPTIKAIGQTEMSYMNDIAYDENYAGFAADTREGERMAGILGGKNILFLANHGVVVLGRTIAEAYDRLYYLERACQQQLYAMWSEKPLKFVRQEVIDRTEAHFKNLPKQGANSGPQLHFEALKRVYLGPPPKRYDA